MACLLHHIGWHAHLFQRLALWKIVHTPNKAQRNDEALRCPSLVSVAYAQDKLPTKDDDVDEADFIKVFTPKKIQNSRISNAYIKQYL